MQRRLVAGFLLYLLVGCGSSEVKTNEKNDWRKEVPADGSGDDQVKSPSGDQGPTGASGSKGDAGQSGAKGDKGDKGDVGPLGGVTLYDRNGLRIGFKFDFGASKDIADIFVDDGRRVQINMKTGNLEAPDAVACLYESANCQGTCYIHDSSRLNLLTLNAAGQTVIALPGTTNLGGKNFNSTLALSNGTLSCLSTTSNTLESYEAILYTVKLQFPLPAPLYWGLAQ